MQRACILLDLGNVFHAFKGGHLAEKQGYNLALVTIQKKKISSPSSCDNRNPVLLAVFPINLSALLCFVAMFHEN